MIDYDLSQVRANGYGRSFPVLENEGNLPVLNEMNNKLRSGLASDEEHNFKTRTGRLFDIEVCKQSFNFPCLYVDFRHSA